MLAADWALVFIWIVGSSQIVVLGESEGVHTKAKLGVQIKPWRIVDFSSDIFLVQLSLKSHRYIVHVIFTILVTLTGYSLLKFNWKKNSGTTL